MNASKMRWAMAALMIGASSAASVQAEVPAQIEAELTRMGRIVDPACTAKLYRPLMPANDINSGAEPLYPGVAIARDVSFGPDAKDVVDIFSGGRGGDARTVLIYVPGGSGEKIEIQDKEANAFYDNIGRWATKNGMVGVIMQRHFSPGWEDGAKDIARMIQFVQSNIGKYHGNADRIVIWAHSAGNVPLGTYVGRPELWGPKGVGVKGIIFMSPAAFDVAPLSVEMPAPQEFLKMFMLAGKTCSAGGPAATDGALPGKAAGQPGGPSKGPMGPPPAAPPQDAATQLARSSLPALQASTAKIMLANGELDIGIDPAHGEVQPFVQALHDELCKSGSAHCPTLLIAKGHSHMSIVFSIDTPDTSVSAPILAWIKQLE